jgi:cysteinyl-tRNA synthetase
MASDLLGKTFDVHSGGVDLRFPHHDNEIAQSESHGQCSQWVNHFWHAGHLNIAGLKVRTEKAENKIVVLLHHALSSFLSRVISIFCSDV